MGKGGDGLSNTTHINVSIDFSKWDYGAFDLRIPVHQPIKKLLGNITETLNLNIHGVSLFAVKIPAKNLLLTDDDRLMDYSVTSGDVLLVL